MRNFILTCCSTADMPKEFFASRQIPFISFHYTMDGQEYPDDLGQSMPFSEFYKRMADGAQPTTSQVNEYEYTRFFEPFLQSGKDILHITLSSGISGAYQSACIARDALQKAYPERKLIIVDSRGASSGYGLLVSAACDLADGGASIDQVHAYVEDTKLNIHHWFFSTDLSSYYRGGRISHAAYAVGSLLNLCPLLNMDAAGHLIPRSKYQGKKRVMREIVERMRDHADNGLGYAGKCLISNSGCPEDARRVADMVEQTFPKLDGPVMINPVGTVIGAHTGPGTVALFFFGDRRGE